MKEALTKRKKGDIFTKGVNWRRYLLRSSSVFFKLYPMITRDVELRFPQKNNEIGNKCGTIHTHRDNGQVQIKEKTGE